MPYTASTFGPQFSRFNSGNVGFVDSVKLGNFLFWDIFFQKAFNFSNRLVFNFGVSGQISRKKCRKSDFNGVLDLFFLRGPLKIIDAIVLFVPVLVIYRWFAFRIWNKRLSNDSVKKALFVNTVSAKRDSLVSKGNFTRSEKLRLKSAFATSLDRKYFAVKSRKVQSLIAWNLLGVIGQFRDSIMAHS